MSKILTPITLGKTTVKNRIVMPPMCTYKAKNNNGFPRCFHNLHYATRALGGVGLIIVEATAVEARGRITNDDLGLWNDEQIEYHKELVKQCHKFGASIAVQLAHAGRKSECDDSRCVAPSAIKFSEKYSEPLELSLEEIASIKEAFVQAGKRAVAAGYDLVELHAAHGYLLHEFLSPLTNLRKDEFGGSFENRVKLLCEVMDGLRCEGVEFGVRISADEWEVGGFGLDDSLKLAKLIQDFGGVYIHVSAGGNHEKPSLVPKFVPFYQCDYAKEIKKVVNLPVIAVGLITTPSQGEALLLGDVCDMVAYGRELLKNPNLAFYAMSEFKENELIEKSYLRAFV
ncbi:NADH:flavin oxidoreductase/NADH oxidase [Campylobacter geochelonis]|uniref:NADH oxidase n=1 Tax=Campylobacter geochelonis TaxID=1780362 RepID=A0A128EDL4_9BACT|nr:NADH:flavin oxidoreductase/NADH oxidase [Campylobacter geochelonis]QKF71864.1 old yellow enzyme (OYE)-related FMN binding domain-containing protein [Campylobacter geochelonis]CZE47040.1 NADH oxidase [Campylobacter geochelonis]CZE47380.1 NADH oxidase [Campylobacter geochelonis]